MGRFVMFISYLGTQYSGIQKQMVHGIHRKDLKTVLGCLEKALLCLRPSNAGDLRVVSSSRTDSQVHAFANPCHVDLLHRNEEREYEADIVTYAVNKTLERKQEDIRVVKTVRVEDEFHCRRCVRSRHYLYRLALLPRDCAHTFPLSPTELNMSHSVSKPFDMDAVHAAGRLMSGHHDFTAFTSSAVIEKEGKDPVKTMSVAIRPARGFMSDHYPSMYVQPQIWEFHFWSKSFLYHQIRNMMGALVQVGKGRLTMDDLWSMLNEPHTSVRNCMALPGHGLSLVSVEYDQSVFDMRQALPTKQMWGGEDLSGATKTSKDDLVDTLERHYTLLLKRLAGVSKGGGGTSS